VRSWGSRREVSGCRSGRGCCWGEAGVIEKNQTFPEVFCSSFQRTGVPPNRAKEKEMIQNWTQTRGSNGKGGEKVIKSRQDCRNVTGRKGGRGQSRPKEDQRRGVEGIFCAPKPSASGTGCQTSGDIKLRERRCRKAFTSI